MIPGNDRWQRAHNATDVVVIGAGIAGLCAALEAVPRRVCLLCPATPEATSSSALAQGGIAAPLDRNDSVEAHVLDTTQAACHSADSAAVARIIGQAISAIEFLAACGVPFDSDAGVLRLHREAGHGVARVAHAAGDRSGAAVVGALWARVLRADHIRIVTGVQAQALVVSRSGAVIAVQVAGPSGQVECLPCSDVVLATGGVGHLYSRTTNGLFACGDGLAMALAVGARTAGLEFVQFHPTALCVNSDPLPLLTEALRGAGARLRTASGVELMAGRHSLGDLAPRDTVARAVWECCAGGAGVFLDATSLFRGPLAASFPGARETSLRYGLDPAQVPLPVTVAAHYHMGGIVVDSAGRSSVPGLWACGEVACTGLHGANRLASNSLLEAVVCGRAVGSALGAARPRRTVSTAVASGSSVSGVLVDNQDRCWQRLRQRMSRAMGPVREGNALRGALRETLADRMELPPSQTMLNGRFTLAIAMMSAALMREESRGAHWRSDFPDREVARDGALAVYPVEVGHSSQAAS